VFEARRLLYHSTLGFGVLKKKKMRDVSIVDIRNSQHEEKTHLESGLQLL
jgi:hypothetical protein